ncbi:MAG: hypothetical protein ABEJ93_00560 [Candidatus Nanohalobium sp.]
MGEMSVSERHSYAAAAVLGISFLGEGSLILGYSKATVFYGSLVGAVAGIYFYTYFIKGDRE